MFNLISALIFVIVAVRSCIELNETRVPGYLFTMTVWIMLAALAVIAALYI